MAKMKRMKRVRTHTVLADDEKIIGRHTTGQDIIARTYMKNIKEPVLDKNDEQVWIYDRDRNPVTKRFRQVPTEVTEVYVYELLPTGHNRKNYGFRPTEEELAQRDRLERRERLKEEYWDKLLDEQDAGKAAALGDGAHVASAAESLDAEIERRVAEGVAAALEKMTNTTTAGADMGARREESFRDDSVETKGPETKGERDTRIARNKQARERRARAKETAGV